MKYCKDCGVELLLDVNFSEARKKHHMYTCNACSNARSNAWKTEHRAENKLSQKKSKLKFLYNISLEEFKELLLSAKSCCQICGTPLLGSGRDTHIDHCHTTGRIRGVLCNNCNTGLGKFKDNPDLLQKAITYLIRNGYED